MSVLLLSFCVEEKVVVVVVVVAVVAEMGSGLSGGWCW